MQNYIISDQHWGHDTILTLSVHREFLTLEDMDIHMIKAWNERVTPKDVVYHLGDIFWHVEVARRILPQLNGNIKLIRGNHDWWLDEMEDKDYWMFDKIELLPAIHRVNFNKTKIWLCHYAMRVWEGSFKGAMHVYGHCHGTIEKERLPRSMEVSVDVIGYQPWTVEEIWNTLSKDPIMPEEQRISNGLNYAQSMKK